MDAMGGHLLASLTQTKKAKTLRASSWDTSGRNRDAWMIEGGETCVLADLKGPGCITHIWMTQSGEGAFRNVVLKMFWDGEDEPSVAVPLGDVDWARDRDAQTAQREVMLNAEMEEMKRQWVEKQ